MIFFLLFNYDFIVMIISHRMIQCRLFRFQKYSTKCRELIDTCYVILSLVIEMDLGNRITNLRKKKNWTQSDLASQIFVTDKTISSWESNRTEPSLETIIKLSELFDCSASYLIYGDVERNDIETEIKIKISNDEFRRLELFMKNNGEFLQETKQVDIYYQPMYRKFLNDDGESINEWLRIGTRGNRKILNYKNWHNNMYCDEYEVEIDDENNLDKIFKVLGLERIAVVDKVRNTYFI